MAAKILSYEGRQQALRAGWLSFMQDLAEIGFIPSSALPTGELHISTDGSVNPLPLASQGRLGGIAERSAVVARLQSLGAKGRIVFFDREFALLAVETVGDAPVAPPFYLSFDVPRNVPMESRTPSDSHSALCVTTVHGTPATVLEQISTLARGWPKWKAPPRAQKPQRGHIYTLVPTKTGIGIRNTRIPPLERVVSLGKRYEERDAEVRERIRSGTKGLILLHGPPGSGKTTYIRRLIHACDEIGKRIILVPRSMIAHLAGPALVDFLPKLAKQPSVFLVEDAEPLLEVHRSEGTSALLNLTDGILNDVARTQVVCTFNCQLDAIDPALLRDGRLLVRWEFERLSVEDGRAAAAELGLDPEAVTVPMTIAEISATKPLIIASTTKPRTGFGR